MKIEDLTIKQAKELAKMFGSDGGQNVLVAPVKIGESYLFRTVTHIEVGRVKAVDGVFITLEQASWIADTGRYHDCLANGTFSEVEPYPDVSVINSSSLINYAPWDHSLPTEQK